MNKKLLIIFLFFFAVLKINAQKTSVETWNKILKAANVEWNDVYKTCPHFPKNIKDKQTFTIAISKWNNDYPNEVNAFFTLEKVKAINPSPYYLGLPVNEESSYNNSWIQWIKESEISDRRMNEIAPNFPNMELNSEEFNFQFERWISLYGHEYENIINAKELTILNPYYTEYVDVYQLPHFLSALETKDVPVLKGNASKEEKLAFELKLMNWYFVFDYNNFRKQYGFTPEFPEYFDKDNYRASIIRKIEETEKQKQLNNFESN